MRILTPAFRFKFIIIRNLHQAKWKVLEFGRWFCWHNDHSSFRGFKTFLLQNVYWCFFKKSTFLHNCTTTIFHSYYFSLQTFFQEFVVVNWCYWWTVLLMEPESRKILSTGLFFATLFCIWIAIWYLNQGKKKIWRYQANFLLLFWFVCQNSSFKTADCYQNSTHFVNKLSRVFAIWIKVRRRFWRWLQFILFDECCVKWNCLQRPHVKTSAPRIFK